MPKITLYLNEAQIRSEVSGILTSGMVGVEVKLVCDESWEGLHKTLVCRAGDTVKTVLVQDDRAVAAHETLVAGKWLELGVEGRNDDGSVVIPTLWDRCCIVLPGADGNADPTSDPTLPIWAQLQSRVAAVEVPPVPSEIGALPGPVCAKVGQHFCVSAVNRIGQVVAVEAVDMPAGGGSDYVLPAATADTLGGVTAEPATEDDTQPVRIGEDGKLYTVPGVGGEKWETIIDYTVPEDCSQVLLTTDINGNPFSLKKAVAYFVLHPIAEPNEATAVRYAFDSSVGGYLYSAQHFWNAAEAPKNAGKATACRFELTKTNEGVIATARSATGEFSIGTDDVQLKSYTGYEGFDQNSLTPRAGGIDAVGVGSYKTAVGAGTRIKLLGVRE